MKKSRKILSMLLSAAMVCSMFILPASATEPEGGSQATTTTESAAETASRVSMPDENGLKSLDFVKILKTNGASIMTNTTFNFQMVPDTVPASYNGIKDNLDYRTGVGSLTATSSVNSSSLSAVSTYYKSSAIEGATADKVVLGLSENSVEGIKMTPSFDLSTLSFTDTGIYRYKVTEIAEEKSSGKTINYDDTEFIVDLYVGKLSSGELGIEYAVSQTLSGTKKPIVFENSMMIANLKIEKQIDGSQAKATDEFTFWIKIPTGGTSIDLEANYTIPAKITEAGKTDVILDNIKVGGTMEQETGTKTLEEKKTFAEAGNGWCSFTLKAGQSLEINGIPANMVYYLFEESYQENGYDTTHIIQYGSAETPAKSSITDKGSDLNQQTTQQGTNYIGFLNTKNSTPGTGISVDIMPYVVIVLIAAAGTILFVFRKKRPLR